jgi:C-terminal processing protease CtpA/Prc
MSVRPVPEGQFVQKPKQAADGVFSYGWLPEKVGYLHFSQFSNAENSARAIDEIVGEFKNAKAVVIDVRRNQGGDDRIGKLIADRFADSRRLYMTTRDRSGPSHRDFDEPKLWHVEPDGPVQFTGRVLLLTDRTSISAAENFALAMKVLPHVIQVGDLTSGCFADSDRAQLANGWTFSYSVNLFSDHTGFCWEGIGVPPEILVINTEEDERKGRDRVLEVALALALVESLEPRKGGRLDR